jgi:hypothetical protein
MLDIIYYDVAHIFEIYLLMNDILFIEIPACCIKKIFFRSKYDYFFRNECLKFYQKPLFLGIICK